MSTILVSIYGPKKTLNTLMPIFLKHREQQAVQALGRWSLTYHGGLRLQPALKGSPANGGGICSDACHEITATQSISCPPHRHLPGMSELQLAGCPCLRIARNVAQHRTVNSLKTFNSQASSHNVKRSDMPNDYDNLLVNCQSVANTSFSEVKVLLQQREEHL